MLPQWLVLVAVARVLAWVLVAVSPPPPQKAMDTDLAGMCPATFVICLLAATSFVICLLAAT
jgi:hypothetical protein